MRIARPLTLLLALLAMLLIWPTAAGAAPAITITSASSTNTSQITARLSSFTPGETISLQLASSGATPRVVEIPPITIESDGSYTLFITTSGLLGGEYTLSARRGTTVVASATLRVAPRATPTRAPIVATAKPAPTAPSTGSGGALPGLPNTGGGGSHTFPGTGALIALATIPLAALLYGRARARRRASAMIRVRRDENAGRR